MKVSLVLAACLAAAPGGVGAEKLHIVPVHAFLCDSAEHAIAFANALGQGDGEEIAIDRIGRAAKAEACGRWAGQAVIESEAVTVKGGVAYKITAYRFVEDGRQAFGAETTFAPVTSGWDL